MKLHNNSKEIMPTTKLLSFASFLAITLLPLTSHAEYLVNIPLDSTAFAKSGSTGIPTNPTEPTTPSQPEDKTVTLVSNHQTVNDVTGAYYVNLFTSATDSVPFGQQLRFPNIPQLDIFYVKASDDDTFKNAKKLEINGETCVIEQFDDANRTLGCNKSALSKTSVGSTIVIKILR